MEKIIMYIMPITLLVMIGASVFYLARRMAWSFSLNHTMLTIILGSIITIFLVASMVIMRTNMTSGASHLLHNIATVGFGFFTIMLLVLLATDLVNIFVKLAPKVFGLIVMIVTIIVTVYSLWSAQNTKVYYQDIKLPNLVEPLRIAQLSDIHIGHFWGTRTMDKLVSLIEKENVDAVVITGDMFDGRVRLNQEVLNPLKRLTIPIYFVEGNHDGYSGASDIKQLLRENGINVLSNEKTEFKGLQIIGLDYLMADRNTANTFHAPLARTTIEEVLPTLGIDKTRASLLLHHNPIGINYVAENGINLYLAGHTHAGQMFPATLIAKMMFEYNKGLYRYNDTTQIYVSQGSGSFGPPMRLGTESEITILNLIK